MSFNKNVVVSVVMLLAVFGLVFGATTSWIIAAEEQNQPPPGWEVVVNPIRDIFSSIGKGLSDFFGGAFESLRNAVMGFIQGVANLVNSVISTITAPFVWIKEGLVKIFKAIFGFGLLAYGARRMVTKNQDRLGLFFSFIGASVVLSLAATTDTEEAPYGVPAIGWLIGGLIMLGVGITIGSLSQRFPAIGIIFRGIGFIFIITGAAMMMFGVTPEYATWTLYGWAVLVLLIALWVVASYILRLR